MFSIMPAPGLQMGIGLDWAPRWELVRVNCTPEVRGDLLCLFVDGSYILLYFAGPVGVQGLTTTRWELVSNNASGHTSEDFSSKRCVFTHESLPLRATL